MGAPHRRRRARHRRRADRLPGAGDDRRGGAGGARPASIWETVTRELLAGRQLSPHQREAALAAPPRPRTSRSGSRTCCARAGGAGARRWRGVERRCGVAASARGGAGERRSARRRRGPARASAARAQAWASASSGRCRRRRAGQRGPRTCHATPTSPWRSAAPSPLSSGGCAAPSRQSATRECSTSPTACRHTCARRCCRPRCARSPSTRRPASRCATSPARSRPPACSRRCASSPPIARSSRRAPLRLARELTAAAHAAREAAAAPVDAGAAAALHELFRDRDVDRVGQPPPSPDDRRSVVELPRPRPLAARCPTSARAATRLARRGARPPAHDHAARARSPRGCRRSRPRSRRCGAWRTSTAASCSPASIQQAAGIVEALRGMLAAGARRRRLRRRAAPLRRAARQPRDDRAPCSPRCPTCRRRRRRASSSTCWGRWRCATSSPRCRRRPTARAATSCSTCSPRWDRRWCRTPHCCSATRAGTWCAT